MEPIVGEPLLEVTVSADRDLFEKVLARRCVDFRRYGRIEWESFSADDLRCGVCFSPPNARFPIRYTVNVNHFVVDVRIEHRFPNVFTAIAADWVGSRLKRAVKIAYREAFGTTFLMNLGEWVLDHSLHPLQASEIIGDLREKRIGKARCSRTRAALWHATAVLSVIIAHVMQDVRMYALFKGSSRAVKDLILLVPQSIEDVSRGLIDFIRRKWHGATKDGWKRALPRLLLSVVLLPVHIVGWSIGMIVYRVQERSKKRVFSIFFDGTQYSEVDGDSPSVANTTQNSSVSRAMWLRRLMAAWRRRVVRRTMRKSFFEAVNLSSMKASPCVLLVYDRDRDLYHLTDSTSIGAGGRGSFFIGSRWINRTTAENLLCYTYLRLGNGVWDFDPQFQSLLEPASDWFAVLYFLTDRGDLFGVRADFDMEDPTAVMLHPRAARSVERVKGESLVAPYRSQRC